MPSLLARYATPLTTGLFMISLISGVALFFHWQSGLFHSMHEWLSIVLIVPFVLHIWKNWRAFVNYFKRPAMAISLVATLIAGAVFAYPSLTAQQNQNGQGGRPEFALLNAIPNASVAEISAVLDKDTADVSTALTEAGYSVENVDTSLADIATASGKSSRDIISTIAQLAR